jgi:hypothetical protein
MSEQIRIPSEPKPPKILEEEEDKVKFALQDGIIKEFPIVEPETTQPPKKRLNATISLLLATVIVAFFILLESKILNLPFTFRQHLLGPYLQVLHEWVLFVKHIYTFLKKAYPNNALTTSFEKIIIYVVDTIPYEPLKDYLKTAPQTVALRPHIKNALLESLTSLQTPENAPFINRLKEFFEEIEKLFEIGRILGIDQATLNKINSEDAKYIDLLHIINNYQTRFNQFMDYFIKLFNTILSTATTIDPTQEDAIFQSVSEITRSATDFQAANIVSNLLSKTIPHLIKDVDDILQEKFAEEGPTIEEINGGKRKTRRRKTLSKKHRKQKTSSKKYRKQNSNRKRRNTNTRIVYQKLNRLVKFLLI